MTAGSKYGARWQDDVGQRCRGRTVWGDEKWATMVQMMATVQGGQIMGRQWCGVPGLDPVGDDVGAERMQEGEDADVGGQMCGETMIGMVMVEVGGGCDGMSVARRGRGGIR